MKQRGKMFNQLYLIIEENKLKKRFKGNVVTAVLEVLNKETDVQRLELIYQTLWRFNDAKMCIRDRALNQKGIPTIRGAEKWQDGVIQDLSLIHIYGKKSGF